MAGPADPLTELAFVGHLDSVSAYAEALAALRGEDLPRLAAEEVEARVRRTTPMPVCELTVRSATGAERSAVYIDAFLLVDQGFAAMAAVRKVERACEEARLCGARIAALGGFTSIVGEQAGLPAMQARTAFTTGNTLTAAVIAAQVSAAAPRGSAVVVVGAGGDVGSGVARILAARGHRIWCCGRKPGPVQAVADEIGGAVRPWEEAAREADVVVLVASAPKGGIPLADVRPGALVFDAGHPPNGSGRATFAAGRIVHSCPPVGGIAAFLDHGGAGQHHACLAEAEVLAFEGRFEPYSFGRGRITVEAADRILGLAERHGITPAPLRAAYVER